MISSGTGFQNPDAVAQFVIYLLFQFSISAAGFSFSDVVQAQVFLANLDDYKAMNSIYAEYFNKEPPARAVVEAAKIPRGALVEIVMVAVSVNQYEQ